MLSHTRRTYIDEYKDPESNNKLSTSIYNRQSWADRHTDIDNKNDNFV